MVTQMTNPNLYTSQDVIDKQRKVYNLQTFPLDAMTLEDADTAPNEKESTDWRCPLCHTTVRPGCDFISMDQGRPVCQIHSQTAADLSRRQYFACRQCH